MNADFFTTGFMGVVVGMIIMLLVLVAVAYWPSKRREKKSFLSESDRALIKVLTEKKKELDRASIVREQLSVLSDGSQTRASSIDFIARDILAHERKISADEDSMDSWGRTDSDYRMEAYNTLEGRKGAEVAGKDWVIFYRGKYSQMWTCVSMEPKEIFSVFVYADVVSNGVDVIRKE